MISVPGQPEDSDEVDELLLLQIAQADDPVSPRLSATMVAPQGRASSVEQQMPPSSLVQRPKSSGIDVTAFSFAKPLQHGKVFSLKPAVKPQITSMSNKILGQGKSEKGDMNDTIQEESNPR